MYCKWEQLTTLALTLLRTILRSLDFLRVFLRNLLGVKDEFLPHTQTLVFHFHFQRVKTEWKGSTLVCPPYYMFCIVLILDNKMGKSNI